MGKDPREIREHHDSDVCMFVILYKLLSFILNRNSDSCDSKDKGFMNMSPEKLVGLGTLLSW